MSSIFAWTTGSPGLDRIRISLPLEQLQKQGYDTAYGSKFYKEHGSADTLIGCRVALPDPSRIWTSACGMMGGPFCVFETDDDNLGIAKSNPVPYKFWSDSKVRFHYVANMRTAHRIVTSTPYLQDLIQDQTGHPDVVIARNAVPAWMGELEPYHTIDDSVVVGWAGGESHYGDWEWAKSGIRRAMVQFPMAKLRFIGSDYRKSMRLPKHQMEHVPWFQDVDQYWANGLNMDIGLAPLRPHEFNRSKSEIKLLEYGIRGIPVVAQDYGIYHDYVQDGVTGFLVKNPKDWTEALVALIKDPDLRWKMGRAAREQAKERTIEAIWPEYEEAYVP